MELMETEDAIWNRYWLKNGVDLWHFSVPTYFPLKELYLIFILYLDKSLWQDFRSLTPLFSGEEIKGAKN